MLGFEPKVDLRNYNGSQATELRPKLKMTKLTFEADAADGELGVVGQRVVLGLFAEKNQDGT